MNKSNQLVFCKDGQLITAIKKITDHKPTQAILHQIAGQSRFLYDSFRDGFFLTDKKYRIKFWNKAAEKIVGKNCGKLTDQYCWQVIYGDKKCKKNCPFIRAKKTRRRESSEYSINKRVYRVTVDPVFDHKQNFVGAFHIFTDITKQINLEKKLVENEEKYEGLVRNIDIGIYRTTPQGKFLNVNPAMFRMFGLRSKKSFIKLNAFDLYQNPKDRRRFLRKLKKIGIVTAEELNLRKKNGAPITVSVFAHTHKDKAGKIIWVDGVIEDITERKKLERKLLASEARFRRIVENSRDLIMVTRSDGVIEYLSPICTKILGHTPKDLVGKVARIYHKDDAPIVKKTIALALQGNSGSNVEYRIITKKGKTKWITHSWAPIKEGRKLARVVSIINDITERKQAEIAEQKKLSQIVRYQDALLKLAKIKASEYRIAIQKILEIDSKTLDVERASFWLISNDESELHCQDLYLKSKNKHEKGIIFYTKKYPYYFNALKKGRIIAVSDVYNNIATFEFDKDYYKPNKIVSLMDVPIWIHGKIIGILCHEHTGPMRKWTTDEQVFATSVADTISVTLEGFRRQIAQKMLKESEEKYRGLVQNLNIGVFQIYPDGRLREANPACIRLFGCTSLEQLQKLQIEDVYADRLGRQNIVQQIQKQGYVKDKTIKIKKLDGTIIIASITAHAHLDKTGNVDWLDGVIEDVTERKQMENILRRREAIFEAIVYASARFLKSPAWDDDIHNILTRLGKAAQVSRAYIFRKHLSHGKRFFFSQLYEWTAQGVTPQIANPDLQNVDIVKTGLERWLTTLSQNRPLFGNICDFPARERELLSLQDIISIAIVPIFKEKTFWGFIGFDDGIEERNWTQTEIDALKIAGNIIGSAVQRQHAEQTLQESEEKYRTLIELSLYGIAAVDSNGKILFINPSAIHLLGATSANQIVGQSAFKFVHPDYRKLIKLRMMKMFRSRKVVEFTEEKYIRLDGSVVVVETSSKPFIYNNKPAIMVIANDITERKRIQSMITESEEKYRGLVQNLNIGIFRTTPDGKFIEANPSMARMFGYKTTKNLIKIPVTSLYKYPRDRNNFINMMRKQGQVIDYQIPQKKKDGSIIMTSIIARAHRNQNGKIDWFDGVVENITERTLAEQALRESEERYRTLFNSANDAIVIMSPDGRTIAANQRLYEMSGFSPEQLGAHISEYGVFSQETLNLIQEKMQARFAGKDVKPYEITFQTKYGTKITIEVTGALLRNADQKVIGTVIFMHNVTERKQAELSIIKAKESAENANQAKTAFVQNISHELRSPLTSIIGYTNLLLDTAQSDENREMLKTIESSGNYLLKTVNNLLDLSKIESGKITFEQKGTKIIDLFDKIYQRFLPIAENKNIKFKLTVHKNVLEYIITDSAKIEQIISNLLDNAFKFTAQGQIELHAQIKRPFLEFFVRDTGIGLSQNRIDEIHRWFFQGKHHVDIHDRGLGLGLSIVKRLTDLLHGKIRLESKLNHGTKFTIWLPVENKKSSKKPGNHSK
ncbi:MAG: PAS domain S-box protein [Candidatus Latescibacteria bacterium]|nr:PAS domain S-box protein [Candidatus Latescibacterota bacterium]